MVTMNVYRDIRECKSRGKTKSETARQLGLARATVRKFWGMSERDYAGFRSRSSRRDQRFDVYRQEIIELVEVNEADDVDVYASSIYDVLEERHGPLPGCARTLRNYLRSLRTSATIAPRDTKRVRRPQEDSKLGDQCQVDFGQIRIAGGMVAYIFVAVLAASRARYVCVQDHPFRTREVLSHLLAGFRYFGGRPRVLVIDQDKLMTVSENGGEIVHTADFEGFVHEQGLSVWLCRKADPQSKGKVENAVKFVKTSFFSARRFMSVEEIHEPLARWLARRANGQICQATGRVPAAVLEHEERPQLGLLRSSIYEQARDAATDARQADEKAMISFAGNRYSVPSEYASCTVGVARIDGHLIVQDAQTGEQIATHRIPQNKGQTRVAAHHRVATGEKAERVYAELADLSRSIHWPTFLSGNREAFSRYWKEQSARLRRLAEGVQNREAFDAAVAFCVETGSLGAGDLKYAYEHLEEAGKLEQDSLLEHASPIIAARRANHPAVAARGVRYYSSLISLVAGGAA